MKRYVDVNDEEKEYFSPYFEFYYVHKYMLVPTFQAVHMCLGTIPVFRQQNVLGGLGQKRGIFTDVLYMLT